CVEGSFGAELVSQLDQDKITKIFQKGTDPGIDSYSGFYDNGHRKSTGLSEWLQEQGVKTVYIMGLAADYCVKYTALDALKEGFETYLITDATRGVNLNPGDTEQAFKEVAEAGGKLVTMSTFMSAS
ncbi:MAG: isochorismatase family protein, partial [Bacteroidota bacterium]